MTLKLFISMAASVFGCMVASAEAFQVKAVNVAGAPGQVTILRGTQTIVVEEGAVILANDIITTSSAGGVNLQTAGCDVELGTDNYLVVNKVSFCATLPYSLDCGCVGGILAGPDKVAAPATIVAAKAPAVASIASVGAPVVAAGATSGSGLIGGAGLIGISSVIAVAANNSGSSNNATSAASVP